MTGWRWGRVLSAGYPIYSHFTASKPSNMGGFNIGGINSTGQVRVLEAEISMCWYNGGFLDPQFYWELRFNRPRYPRRCLVQGILYQPWPTTTTRLQRRIQSGWTDVLSGRRSVLGSGRFALLGCTAYSSRLLFFGGFRWFWSHLLD